MVMSAQTNSVEMGPEMLLVPIPSACRLISQIAIGTANVPDGRQAGSHLAPARPTAES
jgi:hypothetical protein